MTEYITRFSQDLSPLSIKEQKLLSVLERAVECTGVLYAKQKNPAYPGANFYPHDASREEIEAAARENPNILSPYTIVERGPSGELVAVPYIEKFRKELTEASELLVETAELAEDADFKAYLEARAADLFRDDLTESNKLWLKTEHSKIGFVWGPFDRYLDQLFFVKRAYMAWVGVLDGETTERMRRFKEAILASERKYLPGAKRAKIQEVKLRIENTTMFAGLISDFLFIGNNLPSSADLELIRQHGTLFTLFKPTLQWRFSAWVYPIFQSAFSQSLVEQFTEEELFEAFLKTAVLHEACHSLMRYEDAASRLQEHFPFIDEIYTDILGIKGSGSLLLKGGMGERELGAIILMSVCQGFYFFEYQKERHHLNPYVVGYAIIVDFLTRGGAFGGLEAQGGKLSFDFQRAFLAINECSSVLDYYIALGTREEATEFLEQYDIKATFSPFEPYLQEFRKKGRVRATSIRR